MNKNTNNSYFDQAKMENIAQDYKLGTSWQQRLYKKAFYENFDELLFRNEAEIIQDMMEKIVENEEL